MIRGAALSEALLATLANPATWPMALAAFFLRGGLLLVFLPIAVLPSPVGLGNVFAPTLMTLVFQGVSVEVALAAGLVVLAIVAWIVIGGLVAASLEAAAARIVVREDATASPDAGPGPGRRVAARILVARLLAHVPTGVVLVWGSARLVEVTYRELTSPFDVATPIVLRVLRSAPDAIVAIVVAWMLGEIIGAIAARRIVLAGVGVRRALRDAIVVAIRRPLGSCSGSGCPPRAWSSSSCLRRWQPQPHGEPCGSSCVPRTRRAAQRSPSCCSSQSGWSGWY